MEQNAELESTIEALVNVSTRRILDMLATQRDRPSPVLVEQYLASYREELSSIPPEIWTEQLRVLLPADIHDALPEPLRTPLAEAMSVEIRRHVYLALLPILTLLATQHWNLTMERAKRVAAESKAAARRH